MLEKGLVDQEHVTVGWVRTDLQKLQPWWTRISSAMNLQNEDQELKDELPYAKEWCMTLAMEMVKAERASRTGTAWDQGKAEITRDRVWRRLEDLEAGTKKSPTGG